MAEIFLSYASKDRSRVAPLVDAIEQLGIGVWWDRRIGMGASFDREIERELDEASCVVVVWTENSINSEWVRNEAYEGLQRGVLVPIILDNVKPPLAFRRTQSADLTKSGALDLLLGDLLARFDSHSKNTETVTSDVAPTGATASEVKVPLRLNSFVGREAEIIEIVDLLRTSRLVTLIGPGGAGKTRLGMHIAAERAAIHFDLVRFVELAALTDPEIVSDEVAERLDAKIPAGGTALTAIAHQISDRKILLMLDNCEHMIEPVAELVGHLIQDCPNLRVLATSQRPLALAGEVRFAVPPLPLPSSDNLATVSSSDAAQLFLQRAVVVRPEFTIDQSNAPAVASICRQLDGAPLAIELAAARIRVLSPAQIAKRLDERLRLLASSDRDIADRHRTLTAALEWSHDLLSEPEKVVFRRLAVFNGDFEIDAAEYVCNGPPTAAGDVLDLLASLVDKSLVIAEFVDETMRYRLLETVRAFALEYLVAAKERIENQKRHAVHYLEVSQELQRALRSGDTKTATSGLSTEEDNLRAAIEFSLDAAEIALAAGIVGSLGHVWYTSGSFREGIEWGRRLIEKSPNLDDELMAEFLHSYGTLVGTWGRPDIGSDILKRELKLRRKLGNALRLASVLNNLGTNLGQLGHTHEAELHIKEAIETCRNAGVSAALCFQNLGELALSCNHLEDASEHFEQALEEAEQYNHVFAKVSAAMALCHCDLRKGELVGLQVRIEDATKSFSELGVQPGVSDGNMLLGILLLKLNDVVAAARYLVEALDFPDQHWDQSTTYWILQIVAGLCADVQVKARLVATSAHHYDEATEIQPAWVTDEIRILQREISETDVSGRPFGSEVEAIGVARGILEELVVRSAPRD